MSRGWDVEKWREWKVRWERYQASGLTIARFCAKEGVSVNTFHYWARRVGHGASRARVEGAHPEASNCAAETVSAALVRFRLSAAVEVSVPAHCLEVIRCLAHAAQQSEPRSFQEVVVTNR